MPEPSTTAGRNDELRKAIELKVKTWDALCECHDEFGEDAQKYCGEYADADDAAMVKLKAVFDKK